MVTKLEDNFQHFQGHLRLWLLMQERLNQRDRRELRSSKARLQAGAPNGAADSVASGRTRQYASALRHPGLTDNRDLALARAAGPRGRWRPSSTYSTFEDHQVVRGPSLIAS